ncbi:hypothetical protein IHE45_04G026900 [Dioscorea alata]|uniref:Uncharacterized protein n=1 Tax=Dioscorea alata TaxID=55571 RepID=A0ACB7WBC7_DIOAL|nr:hypothetical protein IHE45_04G026900 [Dioscorea alata]
MRCDRVWTRGLQTLGKVTVVEIMVMMGLLHRTGI